METLQRASLWEKMNADEAAFFFYFFKGLARSQPNTSGLFLGLWEKYWYNNTYRISRSPCGFWRNDLIALPWYSFHPGDDYLKGGKRSFMIYKLTKHLDWACNGVRRKTNVSTENANADLLDDYLFPIY